MRLALPPQKTIVIILGKVLGTYLCFRVYILCLFDGSVILLLLEYVGLPSLSSLSLKFSTVNLIL